MDPGDSTKPSDHEPSIMAGLLLTWFNSVGTSIAWAGVFFVAHTQYGFGKRENLMLALVGGTTYVVSAFFSGGILRWLERSRLALTPRRVLYLVMIFMGVAGALPVIAGASWGIWAFTVLYSPLAGLLWPLVESYVAAGRTGAPLRRAMGRFNICWASAVVLGMWLMAPFLEEHALWVFIGLAGLQLGCLPVVALLPARPVAHGAATVDDGQSDPVKTARLLTTFRTLLFVSYGLYAGLMPLLPTKLAELGLDESWRTPLTSVWMIVRVVVFVVFERWHGWHGRWRTPIWSGACLGVGFVLAATANDLLLLSAGLALFGVGFGGAYSAAIYYTMALGRSGVDASGKHEAVIGLGYTLGPLMFLMIGIGG